MAKSITKNIIYNLLFQVVTLVLPLVTLPYVSRVLGANGVGIYSYTSSITQYFILFGTLGLAMYGNRQIAYMRDNKEDMSRAFWSILLLRMCTTGFAAILYITIFIHTKMYNDIYMIQALTIISAMLDISWLYMGLEDFKKIVSRNIIIKILGVFLIFIFIKSYEDLGLYIFINAATLLLGNAVMWIYLPKTVSKVRIKFNDILINIIPSIRLFIPQIAIQIYLVLDKTFLGLLSNVTEVGYYEQSEKIVKATLAVVTVLGIVMMPRMSNLYANGDKEKMNDYLNISLKGVTYVSIPMFIGLIGVANEFVPWFFGDDFNKIKYLIPMLSPILYFIALSSVMGTQYLLPANRIKEYSRSVSIGAIVNIVLNIILIPQYGAIGTCIGTVVAEFTVTAIQYKYLRNEIVKRDYAKCVINFTVASLIMLVPVRLIGVELGATMFTTFIQIIVGFIVYILLLKIFQDSFNDLIIGKIRGVVVKHFYNTTP